MDELLDADGGKDLGKLRVSMMEVLACRKAVKAGDALSPEEIASLLEAIDYTEFPYACQHGRPTVVHFSQNDLEKRFGRKG